MGEPTNTEQVPNGRRKLTSSLLWGLGISVLGSLFLVWLGSLEDLPEDQKLISRTKIAQALQLPLHSLTFPSEFPLNLAPTENVTVFPAYTIDWEVHSKMDRLLRQYRPDYAAFVAMDAMTGQILSLNSYSAKPNPMGHLALRSTYPAASLFKIVTAAAAIDSQKASPDTVISFNGGYHTLYRRNVTTLKKDRWMREMSMKEAFAKSVNTVFAKIGLFLLDPRDLRQYAKRFRFNDANASDVPFSSGQFIVPSEDNWAMAEVASGFNRWITMSPIQGAMMAAALANDGVIMEPYLIEKLNTADGSILYEAAPLPASYAISKESAEDVRSLMRETVFSGTSRKSFRTLLHKKGFGEIEIGGKTGSLTGTSPRGKYDWFVGYALSENPKRKIAIAALTINEATWKVKSSFLARSFIESYYLRYRDVVRKGK